MKFVFGVNLLFQGMSSSSSKLYVVEFRMDSSVYDEEKISTLGVYSTKRNAKKAARALGKKYDIQLIEDIDKYDDPHFWLEIRTVVMDSEINFKLLKRSFFD